MHAPPGDNGRPAPRRAPIERPTTAVRPPAGAGLVRTVGLRGGRVALTLKRLRKGKHRNTVAYLGSSTVTSTQRTWTVRVR